MAGTADKILNVAEKLVQSRGFNAFSYQDVSKAVGIQKASLHYHFATKADLGVALIDRYRGNFLDALKAIETRGESLVKGMENLLADMRRGQLTHTSPDAFKLGENIATTPGKVVYETPLFQLIQYTPTTDTVLKTPLLIFRMR